MYYIYKEEKSSRKLCYLLQDAYRYYVRNTIVNHKGNSFTACETKISLCVQLSCSWGRGTDCKGRQYDNTSSYQDQTISRLSYVYSVHPYDNIKQSGHMCHRRISISLNTFYTCILDRYLKRWLYFQVQHTLSISANPVQGILPQ